MEYKIAVTANAFSKNEALVAALKTHFLDTSFNTKGRYLESELIAALKEAHGAIVGLDNITDTVLAECPGLKVIAKYGVGLDNIDLEAAKKRGVAVVWEAGVNKRSVSELTLGFMLALMRNWYVTSSDLKIGTWNKSGGKNLTGKTIGIIGVGHVGKDLVSLLVPYECRILVNDIREDAEQKEFYKKYFLHEVSKEEIFKTADVVTLHVPLTESTRHMADERAFSQMKPSAFLINTSRGGIVDESALLTALKNKTIAGAGLDVYEAEAEEGFYKKAPYSELLSFKNVITTPHIGGNSEEAVLAMGEVAIKGLRKYFKK
ncbi:MAG: phosphoglycerate dehydrogenase [Patescibacteria group bacterium]